MSLLITSNTDTNHSEYNNQGITGGLNKPNSYSNTIDDLIIPKNAEIAVQSVKINRQGGISLSQKNNIVGLYLGKSVGDFVSRGKNKNLMVSHPEMGDSYKFNGVGITQSLACPIRGVDGGLKDTMGIYEYGNALQHSFGLFRFHPNALRSDINPSGVEVKANYTNGAFTGYDIMFNQSPSASQTNKANAISASKQVIALNKGTSYNSLNALAESLTLTIDGTKLNIVNESGVVDDTDYNDFFPVMPTILSAQPLSLNGGEMVIDITKLYDGSTTDVFNEFNFIGLTRCQRDTFKGLLDESFINPPTYISPASKNMLGDFGVVIDGADKEFTFVMCANNDGITTSTEMIQLDITTTILADTPKAKHRFDSTTYGVNGKKITHIAFLAKGEVMEIALRNASYASGASASDQFVVASAPYSNSNTGLASVGGSGTTITHSASLQNELLKPISQSCQTLYPKFVIGAYDVINIGDASKRNQCVLETYDGLDIKATSLLTDDPAPYGGMAYYSNKPDYLTPSPDGFYDRQTDFYAWCMNDLGQRNLLLRTIDGATQVNRFNDPQSAFGTLNYTTEGISARFVEQFTSGGNSYIGFEPIMVLGFNDFYGTFKQTPNTKTALGFDNDLVDVSTYSLLGASAVVDTNSAGIKLHQIKYSSQFKPNDISSESGFVRVRNLTQDSYNFAKGHSSKILYHIPRFDNAGNDTGALYLEPHERTYLKLNNSAPFNINNIDVDMVDIRDRLIKNLTGQTIVAFHIRPAKM